VKVAIRQSAFADLERIFNWIAKDSPANARSVAKRIQDAISDNLVPYPYIGRSGRRLGTREWIVAGLPYIVVYEVDDARDLITVFSVIHAKQDR
jgi:toxin ParE1/3/4